MTYTSTITTKGQVTIPVDIRNYFKIKPGDSITFEKKKTHIIIKPSDDFLSLGGSLSKHAIKGKTSQQIIDLEHKAIEEAIVEDYLRSEK